MTCLALALACGVAAFLAFRGIGPVPAEKADTLAGIATGIVLVLAIEWWTHRAERD